MPSFCILDQRVVRFMPSLLAAPMGHHLFGPVERMRRFIVGRDEGIDPRSHVQGRVETGALQRRPRQDAEPDLHLIELWNEGYDAGARLEIIFRSDWAIQSR